MGAVGVAFGAAASMGLAGLMQSLLFEVSPRDPLTLVLVSGLLLGIAGLACWVPARRAAAVDPVEALRAD